MTIKSILVPVSGSARDVVALRAAVMLATPFAAHIDVLFARLSPSEAVPLVGEGMSSTVVDQLMQSAESEWAVRARKARASFDEVVAASRLAELDLPPGPDAVTAAWHEVAGRQEDVVVRACHLTDMVVLARPTPATDELQSTLTLEAAVMSGGKPVLLAPPALPESIGAHMAIAWRDSGDCARAVAGAMPLLRRAEQVTVITAGTARTHAGRAAELVSYLAWHGIAAAEQRITPGVEGVGGSLLEAAAQIGADVLVMGGYGHSRMRQLILGGVTRYVLAHAGLPVLMAH